MCNTYVRNEIYIDTFSCEMVGRTVHRHEDIVNKRDVRLMQR
jgi:hypothetical protein